jgi:hypothetical protein
VELPPAILLLHARTPVPRAAPHPAGAARAASHARSAAEADGSLRRLRLEIGFLVEILGVLWVFDFDLLADLGQFQRFNANHFEVAAALGARKDFAFIEFIFFNIQIALALWAQNHDFLPFPSLTGDACLRTRPRIYI